MKIIIATALAALTVNAAFAQQADPSASYRTVETEHFRITFTPDLAHLVTPAAERAEEAYRLLARGVADAPKKRIDILLSDNSDLTNGFAMLFPSTRVVIFVKPPVSDTELQQFRDWLDLVITHELAHTFHFEVAGRVGRALRTVFGRVPSGWPLFPVVGTPRWSTEGLAVEFETRGTGSARTHGSFHEMVVRTAVLEDELDPIDRVSGETPIWPGGSRAYIYGSLFNDFLARTYGPDAQRQLVARTKGSILPPVIVMNRIGKRALGTSLTAAYDAWERDLIVRYRTWSDSLKANGVTTPERITPEGRFAQFPRVSPDGRWLAYAENNGVDESRTRVIPVDGSGAGWSARHNTVGPSDWLSDGSLITAQPDYATRYGIFSDLYRIAESGETRLTTRARIEEPDANRNGRRIVAVEVGRGSGRLVLLNEAGEVSRALTSNTQSTNWSMPRWSPSGDRIAVSRWSEGGNFDVVLMDTLGRIEREITTDEAIDAAPAWSPDGRYVLFWSDRTGIPNLFAYDTREQRLAQVTNVLTGAFHPEVSPDGRWLYFSGYHADGYHIERIPFDPASWRAPPQLRAASAARPRLALDSAAALHVPTTTSGPKEYSSWKTVRPFYWMPQGWKQSFVGEFYGFYTSGTDLLGRHSYFLSVAHAFDEGRNDAFFNYTWAGLGNPTVGVRLSSGWDHRGLGGVIRNNGRDTSLFHVIQREDVGELTLNLLRPRFRSSASFTLGGEVVKRELFVVDTPFRYPDSIDVLIGPVARMGYANYRVPALAISRENGVLLQLSGRWRMESDTVGGSAGYRELTTNTAVYKSLGKLGFAHQVFAVRASGLLRDGSGASPAKVGGVPGTLFDVGIAGVGDATGGLLPVRGFTSGDRRGTRAWTASAEHRVPIALVGRGVRLWPVFLDRMYGAGFFDAGNASCDAATAGRFRSCSPAGADPLMSAGGELGMDVAILAFFTTRMRIGVAQPLSGPTRKTVGYVTFGSAF